VKVFGAPLEMVAAIAVGDLVDINAAISTSVQRRARCGTIVFDNNASITEVMGATVGSLVVTKTGTVRFRPRRRSMPRRSRCSPRQRFVMRSGRSGKAS